MKTMTSYWIAFLCFCLAPQLFAQQSKVSFKSKKPLQLWINGEALHEGYAKDFKLKLRRGDVFDVKFYAEDGSGIVVQETIGIGEKEKKSDYQIKYNKRKDVYTMIAKSSKDKVSFMEGLNNMGDISYSVETEEYSSGPDGVSSSSSKTEGSVGANGINSRTQRGNVTADENGMSADYEESETNTPGANDIAAVGSLFSGNGKKKKKKSKDTPAVEVIKIK